MGGFAWVTLATNDSYSLGALVLAHSLRQVGTAHQLAVLVTPGVTGVMREKLAAVFNVVKEVNILDSRDEANLRLLQRPELGITFTKLHCWRLTQFDKCVFLDADTMVLANADELFEREEFSAAPDVGWPDCFNSGVFVFRPSEDTYSKLVQFALEKGSFDGGDQGLLNLYFADWAYKDISKHLPFIYNMCSTACYSYLPAFKQFGGDVKIIHFIGNSKPWLQYFDTETRQVQVTPDLQHLRGVVQRWWDVFCSLIHPALSPEMAGLAGAFARLTLGVARTAEQSILEDHLRRQGWEVGNIDYMGRDSFDNIWSKICETLASPPQSEAPALVPAEPAVAPPAQAAESSAVPVKTQVPEPVKASETDSTPKEAPVKIEALAPAEAPSEVAKSVAPATETQKPVESCPLPPSPVEAAKPAVPTEPIQPIATAPPSDPAKPAPLSEPLKPTLPSAPTEPAPSEPPKPTPPSEPPKPVAPPSEPPKPVAPPPSEPPKPVAPPSESPKPAAAPSEPPKPAAPSESPKPAIASSEPSKPAATPSEPTKPAAPPSEPSKPAASSEPPKPAAVALPSEPAKPVVPAPEAKVPESPKPVASPPSEPPKPVSVPPSEPPKQEPKPSPPQQPKPKASPAAKPEPEKAPETAAGATKGPASGKQTKAAPEAKAAQPKPESEKAEAAAAPPKSSKTPPTSPLPGAQPKAVPTKEPTSPTPEAAPSAEGQAASGAQGPTPPPRKTGGGGGGGSKKGGKGKK